jgi:hypothetical protein
MENRAISLVESSRDNSLIACRTSSASRQNKVNSRQNKVNEIELISVGRTGLRRGLKRNGRHRARLSRFDCELFLQQIN